MKKLMKDPEIFYMLGIMGTIILIPSENLFVNTILLPICFLLQFIGLFLKIRQYRSEKKAERQGEKQAERQGEKQADKQGEKQEDKNNEE